MMGKRPERTAGPVSRARAPRRHPDGGPWRLRPRGGSRFARSMCRAAWPNQERSSSGVRTRSITFGARNAIETNDSVFEADCRRSLSGSSSIRCRSSAKALCSLSMAALKPNSVSMELALMSMGSAGSRFCRVATTRADRRECGAHYRPGECRVGEAERAKPKSAGGEP